METSYLKETVAIPLSQCLQELVEIRPTDPIEWIAKWLYKYVDNQLYRVEKETYLKDFEEARKNLEEEKTQRLALRACLKTKLKQLKLVAEDGKEKTYDVNKLFTKKKDMKKRLDELAEQKEREEKAKRRMSRASRLSRFSKMSRTSASPSRRSSRGVSGVRRFSRHSQSDIDEVDSDDGAPRKYSSRSPPKPPPQSKARRQTRTATARKQPGLSVRQARKPSDSASPRPNYPDVQFDDGEFYDDDDDGYRRPIDSDQRGSSDEDKERHETSQKRRRTSERIEDSEQRKPGRLREPSKHSEQRESKKPSTHREHSKPKEQTEARFSEAAWKLNCQWGLICEHPVLGSMQPRPPLVYPETPEWWERRGYIKETLYDHEVYSRENDDPYPRWEELEHMSYKDFVREGPWLSEGALRNMHPSLQDAYLMADGGSQGGRRQHKDEHTKSGKHKGSRKMSRT